MPAHYDLKSIGDQVHRLTMQDEAEKLLTDMIFRALYQSGSVTTEQIDGFLDQLPHGSDKEASEFSALLHARMLDIYSIMNAPARGKD